MRSNPWIRLGSLFGVPVRLHLGFVLTGIIFTWPLWHSGRGADVVLALAVALLLLSSLLVHEMAHALVARRFDVRVSSIAIHPFGGWARFDGWARKTPENCAILFAGPFSNLILAAIGALALSLASLDVVAAVDSGGLRDGVAPEGLIVRIARAFAWMNAGLFVVNMLPAFPLDGGRMLYLTLRDRWGRRRASVIVGSLGLAFAGLGAVLALATTLAGSPVVAPLRFRLNWNAMRKPGSARN